MNYNQENKVQKIFEDYFKKDLVISINDYLEKNGSKRKKTK